MHTRPPSTNPPSEPPQRVPWIAPAGGSGSLPIPLTSFVGRDDEITLASALLQRPDVRLLTLTGPGGIGKTRLAIEIARACGPHFQDGVAFVPLGAIRDPSMVMTAVAAELGLREVNNDDVDDMVAFSLRPANILLVIDNFEHVMDAAPAVTRLLSRCPRLMVLVTSRSLLRVEGEHAIPVPPLVLPRITATMTHEDWLRVPVIQLFIERAGAIEPALAWNPGDVLQLVEICERLDGLPLAVELAATRVRHLSLEEINNRLTDLLPLLIDGSRDHPSRLQTMRNAIAWSYDLLSPDGQALLRQASVFSGGFTLEAVAAVAADLAVQAVESGAGDPLRRVVTAAELSAIEERLSTVIDASLLSRETGPIAGTTRYRMLETIREYAWEQLVRHGDAPRARRAHARYIATYAARHEMDELLPEHIHSMDHLVVEQANLQSALAWLLESSDGEFLGSLVAALGPFWLAQSSYQVGRTWSERALAASPAPAPADAARILVSLGMMEIFQGENEAAEVHLARGVTTCREQRQAHSVVLGLIGLGGLAAARGDGDRSTQVLKQARDAVTAIPDRRVAAIMSGWVSVNLAVAAHTMGKGELAERHVEEALHRFRAERFHVGTMMALGDLGDLVRDRGEWARSLALYRKALAVGRANGAKRLVIEIIESVAIVLAHVGHLERGATLLGAAEGLRDRIGLRYRPPRSRPALDKAIETTRLGLPSRTFSAAWEGGRNLSEDQTIARALGPDPGEGTAGTHAFSLTARETEILHLLATGMTDPEIARALFISVRTVEHHVARLFRKLGVRTRAAATSTAIAAGLVAIGGSG